MAGSDEEMISQIMAILSRMEPAERSSAIEQIRASTKSLENDLKIEKENFQEILTAVNRKHNNYLSALPENFTKQKLKEIMGEVSVESDDGACPNQWISLKIKKNHNNMGPSLTQFAAPSSVSDSSCHSKQKTKRSNKNSKIPSNENGLLSIKNKPMRALQKNEVPHHILAISKNNSPLIIPSNVEKQIKSQLSSSVSQMTTPNKKGLKSQR